MLGTMVELGVSRARDGSVGALIQRWRRARNLSQLALAGEAAISARHLSFLETGRAKPSREMVLRLANALQVPLRERNAWLLAAGFAPVYAESKLDEPALSAVRDALRAIMEQQEPFPAVVMNRRWDVLQANGAAQRFFAFLLGGERGPANVLRMMLDPNALRPYVENWQVVVAALVQRVHREALGGSEDPDARELLAEIVRYEGVLAALGRAEPSAPLSPVLPLRFAKDGRRFSFFSAVTTLGTPHDITLQEIRIECFFPADAETDRAARSFLRAGTGDERRSEIAGGPFEQR
jgi:transcriptional regulator with XRE-family HTH domain